MERTISLKTFRVSANGVDLKTGIPERLKLLDWGENTLNTGEKVSVNDVSLKVFGDNQRAMGRETVPIDYEHSTVPGTPAYERSKASDPVAGHGRPYVVQGEGLFIDQVATTPDGLKNAANFKDLSPAPLVENGVVVAMHSLALTHAGAVEGLTLEGAALQAMSASLNFKSFSSDSIPNAYKNGADNNQGFNVMDLKPFRDADTKGELKGLDDKAAMDWIYAKWCGLCGKQGPITLDNMNQTPTWDNQWNAKVEEAAKALITPLSASIATLTAELDSRKSADADAEKNRIVAEALKDGKPVTLTAEQIKGFTLDNLKTFCASLPKGRIALTPMTARQVNGAVWKPLTAMTADERAGVLETNKLRTLDAASVLISQFKRGSVSTN